MISTTTTETTFLFDGGKPMPRKSRIIALPAAYRILATSRRRFIERRQASISCTAKAVRQAGIPVAAAKTSGRVISGSSPLPSMRLVRGQNAASTPMSMRRSSERLKNNYSSPAAHNAPLVSKRRRFVDSHAF